MKGPSPAFPFYAKDWIADTAGLSLEAQGAYVRLLAHAWIEGPLPNDPAALARRIGESPRKFAAIWKLIGHLFQLSNGAWKNKRLEQERTKQMAYREEQSQRGKHGANKRWGMAPAMPEPLAEAMPTGQPKNSFPSPPPNKDRSFLEASNVSEPMDDEKPDPDVVRMRFKHALGGAA